MSVLCENAGRAAALENARQAVILPHSSVPSILQCFPHIEQSVARICCVYSGSTGGEIASVIHQEVFRIIGGRRDAGVVHGDQQNEPLISGASAAH